MNLPLHSEDGRSLLLDYANQGDERVLTWIRRIERYGFTEGLVRDLNEILSEFQMISYTWLDPETMKIVPRFEQPEGIPSSAKWAIAFEIAHLVSAGELKGLKRCALRDCRNFFVGGPRAKWCSDNCGSKFRVRTKRKLDKERQMI